MVKFHTVFFCLVHLVASCFDRRAISEASKSCNLSLNHPIWETTPFLFPDLLYSMKNSELIVSKERLPQRIYVSSTIKLISKLKGF